MSCDVGGLDDRRRARPSWRRPPRRRSSGRGRSDPSRPSPCSRRPPGRRVGRRPRRGARPMRLRPDASVPRPHVTVPQRVGASAVRRGVDERDARRQHVGDRDVVGRTGSGVRDVDRVRERLARRDLLRSVLLDRQVGASCQHRARDRDLVVGPVGVGGRSPRRSRGARTACPRRSPAPRSRSITWTLVRGARVRCVPRSHDSVKTSAMHDPPLLADIESRMRPGANSLSNVVSSAGSESGVAAP